MIKQISRKVSWQLELPGIRPEISSVRVPQNLKSAGAVQLYRNKHYPGTTITCVVTEVWRET